MSLSSKRKSLRQRNCKESIDEVLVVINATAIVCEGEDKGRAAIHPATQSDIPPEC